MNADTLARLCADRAAKRAVALVTELKSGIQRFVYPSDKENDSNIDETIFRAARDALRDDRSRALETPGGRVFIHVHNPPLRLIIVGAVHIAQPLSRMALLAGYAVAVVDPRGAFATAERFAGIVEVQDFSVSREWPGAALTALDPDSRTAVVTLTHDPKLDDPALAVALRSDAFYIGSLGSRRTHGKRRERLAELAFDDAAFARIHGPIGLDIGALSPAEIAISIMAEITLERRRGGAA